MIRIYKTANYDAMSRKAADIVAAQVTLNPASVLGLATGSTPVGMYKLLIERFESGELDFSSVKTINLDEYVGLRSSDTQSYRYFMNNNFFDHINIDKRNTYVPEGTNSDMDAECVRYNRVLCNYPIDIQVLGLGHNGHMGFNEPGDCFENETHVVKLTKSTIDANARFFASSKEVPGYAITMGVGSIMRAKMILMLVSGADKADIVQKVFGGPITPRVPASLLQIHNNVTLVADEAALGKLSLPR